MVAVVGALRCRMRALLPSYTQGTGKFSTSDNVAGTRQLFAGMCTRAYRLYKAPCVCIYIVIPRLTSDPANEFFG